MEIQLKGSVISLFSLDVLFSKLTGPMEIWPFPRTYAREKDEIWKETFSWVLTHTCVGKTEQTS